MSEENQNLTPEGENPNPEGSENGVNEGGMGNPPEESTENAPNPGENPGDEEVSTNPPTPPEETPDENPKDEEEKCEFYDKLKAGEIELGTEVQFVSARKNVVKHKVDKIFLENIKPMSYYIKFKYAVVSAD